MNEAENTQSGTENKEALSTILGKELTAVLKAHANLCATAAGVSGSTPIQELQASVSDADFLMRQYLAYVRTFVEPITAMCYNARIAAESAQTENTTEQKAPWPPTGVVGGEVKNPGE